MHNKDKFPEIWAALEAARATETKLMAKRKGFTDKIKALQPEIQVLQDKKSALNTQAMEDIAQIREVRGNIARMAQAMGGFSLSRQVFYC